MIDIIRQTKHKINNVNDVLSKISSIFFFIIIKVINSIKKSIPNIIETLELVRIYIYIIRYFLLLIILIIYEDIVNNNL